MLLRRLLLGREQRSLSLQARARCGNAPTTCELGLVLERAERRPHRRLRRLCLRLCQRGDGMRVADLAPEPQRPHAAELPQHSSAVGTGEARWLAVALALRVRSLVDRRDADLALELVSRLARRRIVRKHGLAHQSREQRPELARRRDVVHGHLGERARRHARHRRVAGSCTTAIPPRSLTAHSPAVPSSSAPERTTPTTRGPKASAAERKSGSTAGRVRFSRGPRTSRTLPWSSSPASTSMCRSGTQTCTTPGWRAIPFRAATTRSAATRARISGRRLEASGRRWMTTQTAALRSAGSPATTAETASTPPAEAPRRMRSWPGIEVHRRKCSAATTSPRASALAYAGHLRTPYACSCRGPRSRPSSARAAVTREVIERGGDCGRTSSWRVDRLAPWRR